MCLTYYSELEADYYIWIHAQKPKGFLWHKIKTSLFYSSILSLPICGALCGFYPHYSHIILAVQILGYSYLSCFILARYAAFPHPISLPQSILFAVCFVMPPLLLLVIPFFYHILPKTDPHTIMINIENLTKYYGAHQVLKGINLQLASGQVHGIVGENGAGKTTLFKCIAGLEDYGGSISSDFTPLKNHLGFLQTDLFFFSKITGRGVPAIALQRSPIAAHSSTSTPRTSSTCR